MNVNNNNNHHHQSVRQQQQQQRDLTTQNQRPVPSICSKVPRGRENPYPWRVPPWHGCDIWNISIYTPKITILVIVRGVLLLRPKMCRHWSQPRVLPPQRIMAMMTGSAIGYHPKNDNKRINNNK